MTNAVTVQVDAVLQLLDAVLGPDMVAAYLFGSAVSGGLRPHSDIDLFAVSSGRLTEAAKNQLAAGLRPLSSRTLRPRDWRPVELTIVALGDVKPWRYPPRTDFQHGEWLRGQVDAGELEPFEADNQDLAVMIAQLRHAHVVLRGPAAELVLDEVPWSDVERAMRDGVAGLRADAETDTANVLLTLCRIWATLAVGQFIAKDAAADWAAARIGAEHQPVIARARDVYLGTVDDEWGDALAAVNDAVDALVAEIGRA